MSVVTLRVRAENLQAFLRGEPVRNEAILRQWQIEGSRETENMMRVFAPFKSGFYRESIGSRFTPKGFTTYPNIDYAGIVEEGSRPHIIRPRTAKALRWFGVWGQSIFARRVRHPGTRAQKVVFRTWEVMEAILHRLYRHIWSAHHDNA